MTFPILTSLVAIPLVGAVLLLAIPDADRRRAGLIRQVAFVTSLLVFAVSLLLWSRFDGSSPEFQFVERVPWIPDFGIDYYVGVDGISLLLVVLTGFLTPIALLSSWGSVETKVKEFSMFVLALEAAMIGVFVSLDLFLFYVFWDAMLIPMYFLIGVWGYERRVYAAVKFILYTMAGSVLMLLAIIGLAWAHNEATGSPSFNLLDLYGVTLTPQTETGSSWPSPWHSRSRSRSSRFTRGCPTHTSRRPPPARSSSRACC
jgi:NADH-quinone oxidoreductase subunit M